MREKETNITKYLDEVRQRLQMFIDPVTPEMLKCFLDGFWAGCLATNDKLDVYDRIRFSMQVISERGWEVCSTSVAKEMRERGIDEEAIIEEMLQIEIDIWHRIGNKLRSDSQASG